MKRPSRTTIRVCASCEWVFRMQFTTDVGCPKCQSGSYAGRYVYGAKVYGYVNTQTPWKRRKMHPYEATLDAEIAASTRECNGKNQTQISSLGDYSIPVPEKTNWLCWGLSGEVWTYEFNT